MSIDRGCDLAHNSAASRKGGKGSTMATTKTVPSRRREAACKAILDATSEIIAEKGLDNFTISEIGRKAQINRALIYHYFGDRKNLVERAIDHIMRPYDPIRPDEGSEGLKRAARMHVEHPEISRIFFQMLLDGRRLDFVGQKLSEAKEALERLPRDQSSDEPPDPIFAVIMTMLTQTSWAFARKEFARLLNTSLEKADERFVAQLIRSVGTPTRP